MSVSFDSWDPEFHDEMRGRKDSWKRASSSIRIYSRSRNGSLYECNCWTL